MTNPLDRPIWHALTGRQAEFAVGNGLARRFIPEVSPFIACADDSDAALADAAALVGLEERALFLQSGAAPVPPGLIEIERGEGVQMVGKAFAPSAPAKGLIRLGTADAAEMMALAALTKPGPFGLRTHELSHSGGCEAKKTAGCWRCRGAAEAAGHERGQRRVHASRCARTRAGAHAVGACCQRNRAARRGAVLSAMRGTPRDPALRIAGV